MLALGLVVGMLVYPPWLIVKDVRSRGRMKKEVVGSVYAPLWENPKYPIMLPRVVVKPDEIRSFLGRSHAGQVSILARLKGVNNRSRHTLKQYRDMEPDERERRLTELEEKGHVYIYEEQFEGFGELKLDVTRLLLQLLAVSALAGLALMLPRRTAKVGK